MVMGWPAGLTRPVSGCDTARMSLHDAGPSSGRHAGSESPWTTADLSPRRRRFGWPRVLLWGVVVAFGVGLVAAYAIAIPGSHDKKLADYLMTPAGAAASCPSGPLGDADAVDMFGGDLREIDSAVEACWSQDGAEVRVALFRFTSEQAAVTAIDEIGYPATGEVASGVDGVTRGTTFTAGGDTRSVGRNGDIVIVVRTRGSGAPAVTLAGSVLQAQNKRL
jgi:hypothetical protein